VARWGIVIGGGAALAVLAGVFGGWGWAVVAVGVVLFASAFFWGMGQVGGWMQAWSRRLYGGPGDEGRDMWGNVRPGGSRGRRRRG
jgi:hypothetical protein